MELLEECLSRAVVWSQAISLLPALLLTRNKTDDVVRDNCWALSFSHCCNAKAIIVPYHECVFVAWVKHPACNDRAPYCHLCPAPLQNILQYFLINGTIPKSELLNKKLCVLMFCTAFVWNISYSKQSCTRCDQKHILVFMYSALILIGFFNEIWIFWTDILTALRYQISD